MSFSFLCTGLEPCGGVPFGEYEPKLLHCRSGRVCCECGNTYQSRGSHCAYRPDPAEHEDIQVAPPHSDRPSRPLYAPDTLEWQEGLPERDQARARMSCRGSVAHSKICLGARHKRQLPRQASSGTTWIGQSSVRSDTPTASDGCACILRTACKICGGNAHTVGLMSANVSSMAS